MAVQAVYAKLLELTGAHLMTCGDVSKAIVVDEVHCDKCKRTARKLNNENILKGISDCMTLIQTTDAPAIFDKIRKLNSYFTPTSDISIIFSNILAFEGAVKEQFALEMEDPYEMGCFKLEEQTSKPGLMRFVSHLTHSPLNFFEFHLSSTGNVVAFVEYKPNSSFSKELKKRFKFPPGQSDIIPARKIGEFWKILQGTKCLLPEQISEIERFIN